MEFLRHQPDQRAGRAIVRDDVVSIDCDLTRARHENAADDADQCRFSGAIGAQQGKDLASMNIEVDLLERLESRRVAFRQVCDGND